MRLILPRCTAILLTALVVTAASVAEAQTTVSSQAVNPGNTEAAVTVTSAPDTLSSEEEAAADTAGDNSFAAESTQTVVLMGEKVSIEKPTSAKGPFADLALLTTSTLGGRITDLTTHGLTIADTAAMLPDALKVKPDVVVIFTGFSDELASQNKSSKTSDEDLRQNLRALVSGLQGKGSKVFLVPASTTVGASTNANLRLVASDLNATFVPIGTEVSGEPFAEVFSEIHKELLKPKQTPVPLQAAPANTVSLRSKKIETPSAGTKAPAADYEAGKVSLQQELDRIAGEAGEAALTPVDLSMTTSTDIITSSSNSTGRAYPPGGTLTKKGADAQENINMRPLPAVKAFRPQIPVPRNQVDKKEPDLSR